MLSESSCSQLVWYNHLNLVSILFEIVTFGTYTVIPMNYPCLKSFMEVLFLKAVYYCLWFHLNFIYYLCCTHMREVINYLVGVFRTCSQIPYFLVFCLLWIFIFLSQHSMIIEMFIPPKNLIRAWRMFTKCLKVFWGS